MRRNNRNTWLRVVFADECKPCDCCEEPICEKCEDHYSDCECPGPMQDDEFDYIEIDGVLHARKIDDD
jgi:hypothetical protein